MEVIQTQAKTEFTAEERKILDLIFQEKAHESAVISNEVKLPHNKVLAVLWDLRNRGILTRRVHNESPVTFHLVEGKYRPGPPPVEEDPRPLENHMKALNGNGASAEIDPSKMEPWVLEALIISAIKEKFRTFNGIKRRGGFPKAYDISNLLHEMQEREPP